MYVWVYIHLTFPATQRIQSYHISTLEIRKPRHEKVAYFTHSSQGWIWDSDWAVWLLIALCHLALKVWGLKGDKGCKTLSAVGIIDLIAFMPLLLNFSVMTEHILEKRGLPPARHG